jgi:hypothetical protein
MNANPQLLRIFMTMDVGALRALRDNAFDITTSGDGVLINSSVNGTAFTLDWQNSKLSPKDVVVLAQMALDAKARGFTRPITRTKALFN